MKPREDLGVVDSQLNVHGVTNLKIADLSIAPLNVGKNNTALTIGGKATLIITEALRVSSASSQLSDTVPLGYLFFPHHKLVWIFFMHVCRVEMHHRSKK